jgi:hypothetical protein
MVAPLICLFLFDSMFWFSCSLNQELIDNAQRICLTWMIVLAFEKLLIKPDSTFKYTHILYKIANWVHDLQNLFHQLNVLLTYAIVKHGNTSPIILPIIQIGSSFIQEVCGFTFLISPDVGFVASFLFLIISNF